jgi:hypothetical protein
LGKGPNEANETNAPANTVSPYDIVASYHANFGAQSRLGIAELRGKRRLSSDLDLGSDLDAPAPAPPTADDDGDGDGDDGDGDDNVSESTSTQSYGSVSEHMVDSSDRQEGALESSQEPSGDDIRRKAPVLTVQQKKRSWQLDFSSLIS